MTPLLSDKPIEIIHSDSLPDADLEQVAKALTKLVERSAKNDNVQEHIYASEYTVEELSWIHHLIPGLEKLAAKYHFGNYVVVRGTNEPFFESMPLYTRCVGSFDVKGGFEGNFESGWVCISCFMGKKKSSCLGTRESRKFCASSLSRYLFRTLLPSEAFLDKLPF